ncbi:MAG TPA: NUDIX hydrolase [Anaerolineaceae bacterium]|nr:NUDIX hydrolase [Anaerolineaceae bacterium]
MKPGKVRPIALGVFQKDKRILVSEGFDIVKKQAFFRPLGGKIEFGEYGYQTVIREIKEEIHADVTNLNYLGTLENIFIYNGQKGHEIILVYDCEFVDPTMYSKLIINGLEDDGVQIKAVWKSLLEIKEDGVPLYPSGLMQLLTGGT